MVSRYCFLSHSFAVSFVCMYFLDFYYYLRKSIIIILFFLTYRLYPFAFMWISCLLDVVFYPKQRLTSRKFDLCQNLYYQYLCTALLFNLQLEEERWDISHIYWQYVWYICIHQWTIPILLKSYLSSVIFQMMFTCLPLYDILSCSSVSPSLEKIVWTTWELQFFICYKVAIYGIQKNWTSFGPINLIWTQMLWKQLVPLNLLLLHHL